MAAKSEATSTYNLFGNNLDCPISVDYLDSLSSAGINTLSHEPERLKSEHEQMIIQTQSLAFQNYRTFITAAECSRKIYKDFNIIEENLYSLLKSVPEFAGKIENFSNTSKETSTRRKQNSLVLSRHTQILEILEIPQLMDTCVRNNYYEEAIELINYVRRLEKKLASVKIIMDISRDVKKATRLMLDQLLLQLKGNIQLPACLRIISYLRQLEMFTEAELRIKFLQARNSWFQNTIDSIPDKDAYYHISKIIEASRIHLFDIVTQYRAIFSDDEPVYFVDGDCNTNHSNILHAWIGQKITEFTSTLDYDLLCGVGNRLDAVLSQCMYFGLSFGRVGADFRSLLIPVFNKHVISELVQKLEIANKCYEDSLAMLSFSNSIKLIQSHSNVHQNISSDTSLSPPHALLDFPPLAVFTNSMLSCFNDLRNFASIALANSVHKILEHSLDKAVTVFIKWFRLEMQSVHKKDYSRENFLVSLMIKEFLPYINRCLQAIYQHHCPSVIFSSSGTTHPVSNDVSKMAVEKIKQNLKEYLQDEIDNTDQGVDMDFKNNHDFSKIQESSLPENITYMDDSLTDIKISSNDFKSDSDN